MTVYHKGEPWFLTRMACGYIWQARKIDSPQNLVVTINNDKLKEWVDNA